MLDWNAFTLFLYILMRMTGFVVVNPIFGRNGIPGMFKAGFSGVLAVTVYSMYPARGLPMPPNNLSMVVHLFLEFGVGAMIALLVRFFLYIPEQAGEIVDTQMGMSMAKTYDAGSQSSLTSTASLLNILMLLLFFAANGHHTLLRMMITSGEVVPFGQVALGEAAANRAVELFAACALLAAKLSLPILAAELLGQVGMGVLMKVIPQINVFAINIEIKVLIGLALLMLLSSPISDFFLEVEAGMLEELRQALTLATG